MSEEKIISPSDEVRIVNAFKYWYETNTEKGVSSIPDYICKGLLDLYNKEKEKNMKLEKQYKILEVEKVRYNIQYLESNISQTPDTAMLYHSMKKHLETLKEEKIKLEADLQELLQEGE